MFLIDSIIYCYENITPFQTAISISVLLLYFLYLFLRDMDVPPGPTGSPFLGYYPFLNPGTCHLRLRELSKKYGDVFSFRVAGTLIINLGSLKSIREAHITNSDCFGGRYRDSIMSDVFKDGVPFLNGEPWKILRKFMVFKFKEYGFNSVKESAASSVYDALKEFVEELHDSKGQPIEINDMITKKCIVMLRRIIFNDHGMTIEELQEINDEYSEVMKGMTSTNLMLIGKFAKYCMFPFMPSIWKMKRHHKRIQDILCETIRRHKSEYDKSDDADLIDCYFKERDERLEKGDSTAKFFTDKALIDTLNQLTTDGLQTVSAFIGNFLVILVQYPEEQDKLYEEIVQVIGTNRLPTLEDKTKLPYTNAFINEVSRYTDFFPVFPSLQCTKETTISGYKIPEGSVSLLNFYAAHRNPKYFENPDEFNPSRYLPSPDKQRPDLPVTFGIGKRSCIGEGFSMVQTFLFLTAIVQNFHLSLPEGSEALSTVFWSKEKLKICARPRSHKSHSNSN